MNNFYTATIKESDDNSLLATIIFDKQHPIFIGHFPGQPIVPGVCMVEIVKELLQQTMDKSLLLNNAAQVKFLQLVTPDMQVTCSVSWRKEETTITSIATINTDKPVFKMSGVYLVS